MRSSWFMYHDVYLREPVSGAPLSATTYHVSKDIFSAHLSLIRDSGHRVIPISEFVKGNTTDSIVITFDDGWQGAFDIALPMIHRAGWKAAFFVTRDFVGRRGFCTRQMILDAASAGMEIGVHGTTHRMLSGCSRKEILEELSACKDFLESLLGTGVQCASVPGGDVNRLIVSCAKGTGLKCLCTSRVGVNTQNTSYFRLKRLGVRRTTRSSDISRHCHYRIQREQLRWGLYEIPRRLMGMGNYARLSRWLLDSRKSAKEELYKI